MPKKTNKDLQEEVRVLKTKLMWAVGQRNHWLQAFGDKCGFSLVDLKKTAKKEDKFLEMADKNVKG